MNNFNPPKVAILVIKFMAASDLSTFYLRSPDYVNKIPWNSHIKFITELLDY